MRIDLAMSMSKDGAGDIILSVPRNGKVDLAISYEEDVLKQMIYSRLKTQNPDWFMHEGIGANLEDLIGEPNTRETAAKGVSLIKQSLMYGGFLTLYEFSVRAVPVNNKEVLFIVKIHSSDEIVIPILFDYEHGIVYQQ